MKLRLALLVAASLAVCVPAVSAQTITSSANSPAQRVLKRKIAVGRFSNTTRYGKALLIEGEQDPLAKQASDMLVARLVDSGRFLVFERDDLDILGREQEAAKASTNLIGVDTIIVGSVTEFGRKVEGTSGFLNSKTRQVATATVEIRLVDVRTGRAFFSTTGTGSSSVEAKEVAGFGNKAGYDSTLNDQAISAAVSDLMTNVIGKLNERKWQSDVLKVRGSEVIISGGPAQGLRIGDRLDLQTKGEVVTSGQSGLPITIPGQKVATVEVVSFFGDDDVSQGAFTKLVDGQLPGDASQLVVTENGQ